MAGSDKRVFTELWKYGVLVSRKLKDDDVNELLDYSSDDNVEDNSDVESLLNYDSADDE